MSSMNNEQLLTEIQAPTGRVIRLGERYINTCGVELEVKKISKPVNEEDVLVEFMAVDERLTDKWWWGIFLPERRLQVTKEQLA
ncbi:MAG: hypothetical protein ABIQ54_05070 [Gammaproteobacteria bacterium]